MRTALLSLTFLLAGSMAAPAFAHTAAPKKKVTATTKKGKILPMKEYIDQLMAKMTIITDGAFYSYHDKGKL